MRIVEEPTEIPDEPFHSVTIESVNDEYDVSGMSTDTIVFVRVDSVSMFDEALGFAEGFAFLEAAASPIKLEYVDYSDEYGYDELEVNTYD